MKRTGGTAAAERFEDFAVAAWMHVLSGSVSRRPALWTALGNLETRSIAPELEGIGAREPVYVTGLARSGTTILLEALARHPDTATHCYRDYPLLFTPYWWNRFLDRVPRQEQAPRERSHRDGILVTPDSPEALEEMLWMAFFPSSHDPRVSQVLTSGASNDDFARFYRDHVRKLLRLRGGRRYLAKGNYNITRLEYLLALFPDARFVIAVREPLSHIASLAKQHALLCRAERARPRALEYMRRVGHYEFGLDRRPINTGDGARTAAVRVCWSQGREAEGWGLYWSDLYGFVAERLARNPRLREATLVVRYERLCEAPHETLQRVFEHCRLSDAGQSLADMAVRIRAPGYYQPAFDGRETDAIAHHTAAVAERFGYAGDRRSLRGHA